MLSYVTGLRAVAIVLVVVYEIVKHAPGLLFPNAIAHRAAFDGMQGFELFLVVSGFILAYPTLTALRDEGAASLDLRSFALRRNARILPAYFAALALTILVPYAAGRYGLTAFGHAAALPSAANILTQVFFLQNHFQNDAFWALAIQIRTFALFPLLFAAYIRWRWLFALLVIGAAAADLTSAAHSYDLGAFVPFMLGIVAADIRVRPARWARFALPFAIVCAAGAFFSDPFVATLPGPRLASGIESWNPLWALAAFALVVGCGALRPIERLLSLPGIASVGAASYATALVAEPVVAYLLRKATPTIGLPYAALNAFAIAFAIGITFWLVIDRRFAERASRQKALDWCEAILIRLRGAFFDRSLTFEMAQSAETPAEPAQPAQPAVGFGDLAMLIKRTGSAADLAADISATRAHFAERGSFDPFYFEPRRVVATVEDIPVEDTPVEDIPPPPRTIHFHLGPTS
jgi:peptidoglycan/LPS O-acetylase OafA/YrhL